MNTTEYPQYWEYLRPGLAFWYRENSQAFCAWLRWPERTAMPHTTHITLSMIVREMRIEMTRKKGVGTNVQRPNSSGTGKRTDTGKFQFLNVKLSDEDTLYLDEQDIALPELAARVLSLGDDGYGIGIKSLDLGESICVTLTHAAADDATCTLALSSFGSNVRDALLGLLYKFDTKLGGEFPDAANAAVNQKPRFR